MPRIPKRKFQKIEELYEFYTHEKYDINIRALKLMESYWKKNKNIGVIDIFNIEIKESPHINNISVPEDAWIETLISLEEYYVEIEEYELAGRAHNLNKIVSKK